MPRNAVVFSENEDGTYDMTVGGRALAYDVEPWALSSEIRRQRSRIPAGAEFFTEDQTGYRQKMKTQR